MMGISLEYWNTLASQFILMSSLLGGFSITVIASLLNIEESTRITNNLLKSATVAAAAFLVCIFAMTDILMMTTKGYPIEIEKGEFSMAQITGSSAFFVGIVALIITIALSGWTKSRNIGIFTTVVSVIALFLIFLMLS